MKNYESEYREDFYIFWFSQAIKIPTQGKKSKIWIQISCKSKNGSTKKLMEEI